MLPPESFLWSWLLNPVFGVVNYILSFFGIPGILWFAGIHTVVPSFVLMTMTSIGGTMIIFLASLQSLPKDVYEAAALATVGILEFMARWNDLLGPLIYLNTTNKFPIALGLANFSAASGSMPWNL